MVETELIERPSRWDVPFGREAADGGVALEPSDVDIDRLLAIEPFVHMDRDSFPKTIPLHGVIRNDTRLRRYRRGDVIVRQNDYGNSAFLVLSGAVRVALAGLDRKTLGRSERKRKSIWRSLIQGLTNPRSPETRDSAVYRAATAAISGDTESVLVQDVTNVLKIAPGAMELAQNPRMRAGQLFGELAALGRIPRAVTVLADEDAELLEIRWQGLRELMKYDPSLRTHINEQYRRHGLAATLAASPLLSSLSKSAIEQVAAEAVFETYGQFDWHGTYAQLRGREQDPLSREPVIAAQGHYPNGIVLIRAGFARLSRTHGHGERTLSYLGKGDVYGLAELTHNARFSDQVPYRASLRAIGYVDIVRIPTKTFEQLILPHLPSDAIPSVNPPSDEAGPKSTQARVETELLDPGLLEFLVEHRFMNGTATMLIDMDRCTRCDDCVRACAVGHENNPRFVRHGPIHERHMVANACMHCVDPVCMIGCPTGAIHRDEETGEIVINDLTCIGCQVCAASCPYDNIRMVEVRDRRNDDAVMVDPVAGRAILKATKCDLCIEHHGGPACQRACPHDALTRVDMWDRDNLRKVLSR